MFHIVSESATIVNTIATDGTYDSKNETNGRFMSNMISLRDVPYEI